jgi:hypothetical protein
MPTVVVEGKDFLLDEKQAGLMLYIQEAEAIQGGQVNHHLLRIYQLRTSPSRPLHSFSKS